MLAVTLTLVGCGNYGTKLEFNGGDLYYTENVTEADAKKLGDFLVQEKFYDGEEKSVQLDKAGDKYRVRMVVKDEFMEKPEYQQLFPVFAAQLKSAVFNGAPVDIEMCDNSFTTKKTFSSETPS